MTLSPADVLFVDIELDARERISMVGAVLGEQAWQWERPDEARAHLAKVATGVRFVAAHNGHAHDLPRIAAAWPGHPLLYKPLIDTLLLSPLAFPENPYHSLVKDRALVREEGNDPVADARSCRKVLGDILAWLGRVAAASDPRLPLLRRGLVDHVGQAPWRGAAEVLFAGVDDLAPRDALRRVATGWEGRTCETARWRILDAAPEGSTLAWAYVASWLTTPLGSILPAWVWHEFPQTRGLIASLRDRDCGSCAWCLRQHSPEAQLTRWFPDHRSFRPAPSAPDGSSLQRGIVAAGLRDESLFAVLATGGGKSIGFQVPALARYERRGALTVVISPLQSLMKDQVDNLAAKTQTTHAAAVYGALTLVERRAIMERVRLGNVGLLYLSPEQLRNPGVRRMLASREIGAWVFDEAHCIAEWGHDFRPDFWYAPRFIRELAEEQGVPVPPIAAFTATAQPEVTRQIAERVRVELDRDLRRFDGGAERANLTFRVEHREEKARLGRVIELLDAMRDMPGAAVVFCPTRKTCESVSAELEKHGWASAAYHAGLDPKPRRETQERFLRGEIRVIAATSAFGMGVDKPDVRLVVHMEMPSSLESYLQQAGRAGRDGEPAECVLLHADGDLERLLTQGARSRLRQVEIQRVLGVLRKHTRRGHATLTAGEITRLAGPDFAEEPDAETRAVMAVSWIERAGIVQRDENHPRVFQGRPRIQAMDEARRRLAKAGLAPEQVDAALRMLRELFQATATGGWSADDLAELVGVANLPGGDDAYEAGLRAIELLEKMVQNGILTAGVQLSASVAVGGASSASAMLQRVARLQRDLVRLLRELHPDPELGEAEPTCELDLVGVTRGLHGAGSADAFPELVRSLLRALAEDRGPDGKGGLVLVHAGGRRYRARFNAGWDDIEARMAARLDAAATVLRDLIERRAAIADDDVVDFGLADLAEALERDLAHPVSPSESIRAAERALLFLHELDVIQLRNGLAVFRTAMKITPVEEARRRRYNQQDYEPLAEHYEAKRIQALAVNTYAVQTVRDPDRGRQVVRDWFGRGAEHFRRKWLREALAEQAPERLLEGLDQDQRNVVLAPPESNLVIIAGPGSGKTRTVIHRVAWLVRKHDLRPEGMLVLCYNRATAVEIRARLRGLLGDAGTRVTVLTLHALALRLTGAPLQGGGDDGFDRVLREATRLLAAREPRPGLPADEVRERILGRWTHLFVDEYQDVDDAQADLIDALIGRADDEDGRPMTVLAVGDDDQNIYAWRGARTDHLRRFQGRYSAEPAELLQNYRSSGAIVAVANAVVSPLPERLKQSPGRVDDRRAGAPLGGTLEGDLYAGRVVRVQAASEAAAARFVADEIRRLREARRFEGDDDFAVLGRHHQPLWRLWTVLKHEGIEARRPVPERPPVVQVREVVRVLTTLEGAQGLMDGAALDELVSSVRGSAAENPWWRWIEATADEWKAEVGDGRFVGRSVAAFLHERASDERGKPAIGRGVHLGTQHGAKGLEWPVVFALGDVSPGDVRKEPDGERRLAYVAVTRAQKMLYLVEWPGCAAPWSSVTVEAMRTVRAEVPHEAWQPVDRVVIGLGDLWLDFAGREEAASRTSRALEWLSYGSKVTFDVGERVKLRDGNGEVVAAMSKEGSSRLWERLRGADARVLAMVRRTADQTPDATYREKLRANEWWVPVVVAELRR